MSLLKLLYFWACYACPWFPAVPAIGKREDADCIFAQAFGRNTFTDSELGEKLFRIREKAEMHDISAFGELAGLGFDPGRVNRVIGGFCKRLVDALNVPLMGQWEIMYAIWVMSPKWYLDHARLLDVVWPPQRGYFATYHEKLASRRFMEIRGLSRPLEVAHPAMIARATAVLWATGVSPIVEPVSPFAFFLHELWVWDDDSVQGWTRRFLPSPHDVYDGTQESIVDKIMPSFLKREFLGRVHHILHGMVAFRPPAPA